MRHAAWSLDWAAMSERPSYTPHTAALGIEAAWRLLDGRWKVLILFNLFGGQVQRYSDLQRLIPGISQKVLAQQLKALEADGLVERTVVTQKPLRVDYALTPWGQRLCPALDAVLAWLETMPAPCGSDREPASAAQDAPAQYIEPKPARHLG